MINPFFELEKKLIDIESLVISLHEKLDFKSTPPASTSPQTDIIFLNEVCRITNLSKTTIYNLSSTGKIPIIKPLGTKKLMFSRVAIMEWLLKRGDLENEK